MNTEAKAPEFWNDGESAFPYVAQGNQGPFVHPGMTLRDWFAGEALSGVCREYYSGYGEDEIARHAYLIADAMLKARKK